MCLDVHPEHSNLVAVGFYDGRLQEYSTLVQVLRYG